MIKFISTAIVITSALNERTTEVPNINFVK